MWAYTLKRLLLAIPTVFLVSFIVFFIIRLIPGDVLEEVAREVTYG
jgi:peptide/nickel transport system permease protein